MGPPCRIGGHDLDAATDLIGRFAARKHRSAFTALSGSLINSQVTLEPMQFRVESAHRPRFGAQARIGIFEDRAQGHDASLAMLVYLTRKCC